LRLGCFRHCLGLQNAVIKGVEGIYDRHAYHDEKAEALRRLAGLIDKILHPPVGNVVPMVATK
jgi:hypothetical protein